MFKKRWLKRLGAGTLILAALAAVRIMLEPKMGALTIVKVPANERPSIKMAISASAIDHPALMAELAAKRVLLVGEEHFQQEPQSWLQTLIGDLHAIDGRGAVLLLELPGRTQADLDRYLATGDESALEHAFGGSDVLPYKSTVRWARAHREAVTAVRADDENFWHIGIMRFLLTDTRNDTMARTIAAAAEANPGQRIIAYGGRLHMTNAGRYMYDSDTRRPIGARLPALGVPRKDIATVWLFAGQNPVDGIWETPGTVSLAGLAGELPITLIEAYPIYGATRLREIADYAVHLGPATPIKN